LLYENPTPATKIFHENNGVFAMPSLTPSTPGAHKVIPKKHVVEATDLSHEESWGLI